MTHNRDDFLALAREWWSGERHHAGIIYARQESLSVLLGRLLTLLDRFTAEELRDLILPLHAFEPA